MATASKEKDLVTEKKKVHFSSEAYPTTIPPFILTDRNFNFMLGAIRHPGET